MRKLACLLAIVISLATVNAHAIGIEAWNSDASQNTSTPPYGAPTGMLAGQVNPTMRQIMAAVRRWYEAPEWINAGYGLSYVSSTGFAISGNRTSLFSVGRRVKITQSGNPVYGTITSSTYSSPSTTVIIATDAGTVSSTLTAAFYSVLSSPNSLTGGNNNDIVYAKQFGVKADGSTDDTTALNSALTFAAARATVVSGSLGGVVQLPSGTTVACGVTIPRMVVLQGYQVGGSELKMKDSCNADLLVSENFSTLTLSGLTVAASSSVPSWFGIKDLRLNGNNANNSSGRMVAFYGTAIFMKGDIEAFNCPADCFYTEYAGVGGSSTWQGQEESHFGNITAYRGNGVGWVYRGPHNSTINSFTAGAMGSWGFYSEVSGSTYSGNLDYIGSIHTYANGNDKGIHFGEVARVGAAISDGDNLEISATGVTISQWRAANIGGVREGLEISGSQNTIGSVYGNMWASSSDKTGIIMHGNKNHIGSVLLTDNNGSNNGIRIEGDKNIIDGLYLTGFTASNTMAVSVLGAFNRVTGYMDNNNLSFNNQGTGRTYANLEIFTNAGQTAVSGTVGTTDRIYINSGGSDVRHLSLISNKPVLNAETASNTAGAAVVKQSTNTVTGGLVVETSGGGGQFNIGFDSSGRPALQNGTVGFPTYYQPTFIGIGNTVGGGSLTITGSISSSSWVKVGSPTTVPSCSAGSAGSLWYNGGDKCMYFCNDSAPVKITAAGC